MSYHYSRTLGRPFDEAVATVAETLKRHGFGVVTEIDVSATLRNKLDVDFRPYRILGACNPQLAYRVLQAEDRIGVLLPCNVVVQQRGNGQVEVSAVDPVATMQVADNAALADIAAEVRGMLRRAIDDLPA